jgi:hypothetical protein
MALERELETYRKHLPELLGQQGKYVLISGDKVDSIWDTQEDALQAGYDRFGLEPFLVKEIAEVETPRFFSRNIK